MRVILVCLAQVKQASTVNEVQKCNPKVTINISGTSKFAEAKQVVDAKQQPRQFLIQKTIVCGSKYGLGVFTLFRNGEKQIGWIPEKDQEMFKRVEEMMDNPTFHVSLQTASAKRLTDTFEKIDICILCSLGMDDKQNIHISLML